mmetsp:Transcript_8729/g.16022  ORF Transcript_8729/g.16022 Transcript_8729/m.16022 type:complete len:125 (+) Transcript_8729:1110-1484(+)
MCFDCHFCKAEKACIEFFRFQKPDRPKVRDRMNYCADKHQAAYETHCSRTYEIDPRRFRHYNHDTEQTANYTRTKKCGPCQQNLVKYNSNFFIKEAKFNERSVHSLWGNSVTQKPVNHVQTFQG